MDRKTISNYLRIAAEHGLTTGVTDDYPTETALAVFRTVHGPQMKPLSLTSASAPLIPHRELLSGWLEKDGLTLTKSHIKLGRMGVVVSYSALYRYARNEFGFGGPKVTVRMAETEPGEVAQVDFGRMGMIFDPESGKQRVLHALVVTLVFSRHQYVYLTHRQELDALICGMEEAWEFFGGISRRLVLDNMKVAVVKADRYEPVFNRTFQEYSQHRGFIIDPAPVRHPEAKGCVENQIKYVRDNFFAGEEFSNREHAQRTALTWCCTTAGLRLHGTTRKRPLLVFEEEEQKVLLPLSSERFDVPVYGISDPQTNITLSSRSIRGVTGYTQSKIGSMTFDNAQYGEIGESTRVSSHTTFTRWMILDAYDAMTFSKESKLTPAWKTTVASTGRSDDLRSVIPVLTASSIRYIGTNTGKKLNFTIYEKDPTVLHVKGIEPK